MITIQQQPEPADFNKKVRQKGIRALNNYNKQPINRNFWKNHDFWKNCHNDLMLAYNRTSRQSAFVFSFPSIVF